MHHDDDDDHFFLKHLIFGVAHFIKATVLFLIDFIDWEDWTDNNIGSNDAEDENRRRRNNTKRDNK